jgi:hypothetical protein
MDREGSIIFSALIERYTTKSANIVLAMIGEGNIKIKIRHKEHS